MSVKALAEAVRERGWRQCISVKDAKLDRVCQSLELTLEGQESYSSVVGKAEVFVRNAVAKMEGVVRLFDPRDSISVRQLVTDYGLTDPQLEVIGKSAPLVAIAESFLEHSWDVDAKIFFIALTSPNELVQADPSAFVESYKRVIALVCDVVGAMVDGEGYQVM